MTRKKKPITEEEFAGWRDDPVTQWVMGELEKSAEKQKAGWLAATWEAKTALCDELLLVELKTRADAYRALAELSYADLTEITE